MIKHMQSSKYIKGFLREIKPVEQEANSQIVLNPNVKFQKMLGFGGAFTEAAAYTFNQMPQEKQKIFLDAYFNPVFGLSYNLGRVSIHSCDFSLENYTYVDDYDETLNTFDISRDLKTVIPMIQAAEITRGDKINILASPWSPPAWMKTNSDMNHGGKLLDKYKALWADYYIKFFDAYSKHGVHFFALTVQNEPAAKQVWDSCLYSKEEEKDFVRDYLGPKLKASAFRDLKLLIWDHNRDVILERAQAAYDDIEASEYIWGTAYHWYDNEPFENLSELHKRYPNKHILFTEGTVEGGVKPNQFETGERYARNMIGDFNHYSEGYIEWNLLLNEEGGPNHVGNYCDAPIIYDRQKDELRFNSSYYLIGHFSKYVDIGASRIDSKSDSKRLKHVAFLNPNQEIVLVIQNETVEEEIVKINESHYLIEARSVSTILLKGE